MIVGGERVEPYNDQHFTRVRQRYGCSEEDLAATRAELATVSAELAAEMQPRAVAATA